MKKTLSNNQQGLNLLTPVFLFSFANTAGSRVSM